MIGEQEHVGIDEVAAAGLRVSLQLRIPCALLDLVANAFPLRLAFFNVDLVELTARLQF